MRLTSAFVFAFKTKPDAVSEAANRFFHDDDLKRGQPLHALHTYVNTQNFAVESRGSSNTTTLKALVAIRATLDGRQLSKLQMKDGSDAEVVRKSFLPPWVK